mmetsp:Transcript_1063/g.2978  ORF Transcript_1063/g.2978 Transcript_1063/m.2978 type:complete len:219 (-) Transcript_1063:625-1281(-)
MLHRGFRFSLSPLFLLSSFLLQLLCSAPILFLLGSLLLQQAPRLFLLRFLPAFPLSLKLLFLPQLPLRLCGCFSAFLFLFFSSLNLGLFRFALGSSCLGFGLFAFLLCCFVRSLLCRLSPFCFFFCLLSGNFFFLSLLDQSLFFFLLRSFLFFLLTLGFDLPLSFGSFLCRTILAFDLLRFCPATFPLSFFALFSFCAFSRYPCTFRCRVVLFRVSIS